MTVRNSSWLTHHSQHRWMTRARRAIYDLSTFSRWHPQLRSSQLSWAAPPGEHGKRRMGGELHLCPRCRHVEGVVTRTIKVPRGVRRRIRIELELVWRFVASGLKGLNAWLKSNHDQSYLAALKWALQLIPWITHEFWCPIHVKLMFNRDNRCDLAIAQSWLDGSV